MHVCMLACKLVCKQTMHVAFLWLSVQVKDRSAPRIRQLVLPQASVRLGSHLPLAWEKLQNLCSPRIASYVSTKSALVPEQQLNITTVGAETSIILEWSPGI